MAMNGSDSNPGTIDEPWRTVQHALDVLSPGQRALVREGTYSESLLMERDGTPLAPITIANYPGEEVVLRPAGGQTDNYVLVLYSVSYARLSGFVIEGANGPSSASVYLQADTHHVELSGNDIRNNLTQGISVTRRPTTCRSSATRSMTTALTLSSPTPMASISRAPTSWSPTT